MFIKGCAYISNCLLYDMSILGVSHGPVSVYVSTLYLYIFICPYYNVSIIRDVYIDGAFGTEGDNNRGVNYRGVFYIGVYYKGSIIGCAY